MTRLFIFILLVAVSSPVCLAQRVGANTSSPAKSAPSPTSPAGVQATQWLGLLVAIEGYDEVSQNLPPLRGCANDMAALQTEWLDNVGEGTRRVVFLNDRNAEGQPTRERILRQLDEVCRRSDANTNLVVALSCHGLAIQGKSYLCPQDCVYRPATSNWDNLLAVSEIIERLQSAKALRKLLILDACRTSTSSVSSVGGDFMSEFVSLSKSITATLGQPQASSNLAVLSSCSLAQEAHEMIVDGQPRGVFMKYFLEGLAGPADYSGVIDGRITLSEAHAYAFAQTSKFVYLCRNKRQQTPEIFRENSLTDFILADTHPLLKSRDETDLQFLLRGGMELALRGVYPLAVDVLSHIIAHEPNNHIAMACRSSAFVSMEDYRAAMNDCDRLGKTLDLFLRFSPQDNKDFQKRLDALKTTAEKEALVRQSRKVRILTDKNSEATSVAEWEPGQKVSISQMDGSWFYVVRVDDNPTQNGLGWIASDNVTWSPKQIEQYRPQTPIHTPSGSWDDKVGGLNFRQQGGLSGGGSGRAVMQRTIGGGGI